MIKKIKAQFFSRELYYELLMIIIVSLTCLGILTANIAVKRSESSYINSYVESNQLILERSSIEFENLNNTINNMLSSIKSSNATQNYFTQFRTTQEKYQDIVALRHFLDETKTTLYDGINYNLILIGLNDNTYYNQSTRVYSQDELINKEFIKQVNTDPEHIQAFFLSSGLTALTRGEAIHLFVSAVLDDRQSILGYAFIEITEADFSSLYNDIIATNVNTIKIVTAENKIISSNNPSLLGTTTNQEQQLPRFIEQETPIQTLNLRLISTIDKQALGKQMNVWPPVLTVLILIIAIISIVLSAYIRHILKPIYQLIALTPKIIEGDFNQPMTVSGTKEIKELITSYNHMQQGLNIFVQQLIKAENEKKEAEIGALQLQIKPHFIYNTLTSIKFLILQNQNELAAETIEAFSKLLEYSIYNDKEMITLKEEITLSQQFAKILQTRYGDRIQLLSMVFPEFNEILIPKLVLQPFIENAFIHGFPHNMSGTIVIDASLVNEYLEIEIIDTGVGFANAEDHSDKTFSGIGIHNINQRLSLIYQDDYCLSVNTMESNGTLITLKIPIKKAEVD
ncbi:histidine kinase [uncultured Vagococcus sp.]|uniref:sensor histidine kinase n=1 Tax=uncultured Vagococcus sp. TaxID=189676 RepID=UPI0028D8F1F0|nr:histidine kinase [uncultured Vagococcus sp.]